MGPLLLTRLTDITGDRANTYQYQNLRLYLHKSSIATTGVLEHWSKIYYTADEPVLVISDSTAESSLRTMITSAGGQITYDTTILFAYNDTTGLAGRNFSYNDGQLTSITTNQYSADTLLASRKYDYSWTDGNITTVSQFLLTEGVWVPELTLTLEYDDHPNAFGEDPVYRYTLPEIEYYRISENNHVRVISSATGALNFIYSYNRFELPAKYTSTTGIEYNFVYAEQR